MPYNSKAGMGRQGKWDTGRGSASSQGSFWHRSFKDLNFKPGPPGTCEGVFGRIVVWDVSSLNKTLKYLITGVSIALLPQDGKCLEACLPCKNPLLAFQYPIHKLSQEIPTVMPSNHIYILSISLHFITTLIISPLKYCHGLRTLPP